MMKLMKLKYAVGGAVAALLLCSGSIASAQLKVYTPGEYPAPRDPDYKKALRATVEDLMPIARVVVRKPAGRQPLEPGYAIKPGERVMIVVPQDFDDRVLEAIRRAMVELGGRPDVVKYWNGAERVKINANVGDTEVRFRETGNGPMPSGFDFPRALMNTGKNSPGGAHDLVLFGQGGPVPASPYGWEYIPWTTVDKFMFSQAALPYEIQQAINDKIWDIIQNSTKNHAWDPEGTDFSWVWHSSWVAVQSQEYPALENGRQTGHDSMNPQFNNPGDTEGNGIIAGTINHAGTYPRIVLTLKDGAITNIEGGGEYGKKWLQMLGACKNIQYPGFPKAGCGWWEESAIGTDVWRARSLGVSDYAGEASWERGRAGVIHWGLGVSRNVETLTEVRKWFEINKTPAGPWHGHVHTYFNTVDLTQKSGKVVRLIDKGRLTLLDDPDIRKIAAKYGNPDEVLKEKWIPGIPGINMPGDYLKDYAPDPYKVIAAHLRSQSNLAKGTPDARTDPHDEVALSIEGNLRIQK